MYICIYMRSLWDRQHVNAKHGHNQQQREDGVYVEKIYMYMHGNLVGTMHGAIGAIQLKCSSCTMHAVVEQHSLRSRYVHVQYHIQL